MNAVRVERFGGPEVLSLQARELPAPAADQVLIRVGAAAVNYSDVLKRRGDYPGGPTPPFWAGVEGAGEIASSGERVAFLTDEGAHATHVLAHRAACVLLPGEISYEQGAATFVSYLTAYHALISRARAVKGETVLVTAAAGALGIALIQIGRILGLTIIGAASSAEKRAAARAAGADQAIEYSQISATRPDIVVESVGGEIFRDAARAMTRSGRLVLVGVASGEAPRVDATRLLMRSQSLLGLHLSDHLGDADARDCLFGWIKTGEVAVGVGHVLPLADVAAAHELLASRNSIGKVVLVP